jgi:mono/diheme cytochrome c family protein
MKVLTYSMLLGALVSTSCKTDPEIPQSPSYATHVKPILEANCVRCHGQGGTLNQWYADDGALLSGAPGVCYFNMYDDTGDCSVPDGGGAFDPSCKRGAKYCATPFPDAPTKSYLDIYLFDITQEEGGMPPLPSPPVSERDKEIVRRWEANPIP